MPIRLLQPLTPIHVVDGAAFSTFTTFQDISPVPQLVIPQQMLEVGFDLQLEAWGEYSTTGAPTLALGFWFNGAAGAAPTSILAEGPAQTAGSGVTSVQWHALWRGRLRAIGASGSFNGQGLIDLGATVATFNVAVPCPVTAAARTVAVDTTAARAIGVGAAWGTSSASNSIKVNNLSALAMSG
jgi:hypothetical protein